MCVWRWWAYVCTGEVGGPSTYCCGVSVIWRSVDTTQVLSSCRCYIGNNINHQPPSSLFHGTAASTNPTPSERFAFLDQSQRAAYHFSLLSIFMWLELLAFAFFCSSSYMWWCIVRHLFTITSSSWSFSYLTLSSFPCYSSYTGRRRGERDSSLLPPHHRKWSACSSKSSKTLSHQILS